MIERSITICKKGIRLTLVFPSDGNKRMMKIVSVFTASFLDSFVKKVKLLEPGYRAHTAAPKLDSVKEVIQQDGFMRLSDDV